jgi:glycosyltransferase involved in cell wall biosynthesis
MRSVAKPGWWLRIAGENQAGLEWDPSLPEFVRLSIYAETNGVGYDLQLNQGAYEAAAGESYRLTFRGRADADRQVGVGFSLSTAPWSNLGLYESLEFTSEWRDFSLDFRASSDDPFGRIHFDVGNSSVSVEIASVSLWRVTPTGLMLMDRSNTRPSISAVPVEDGPQPGVVPVVPELGEWVLAVPNPPKPRVLPAFRMFAVLGTWMEEDVVGACVRNAMAQGCERVYLVDNDSPDGTVEAALREGATLARSFQTTRYDEDLRLRHMNDVVSEVSRADGSEHIWWLYLDADEFPHGPWGMTLKEYLANLDARFRVVGTRYFNHYPSSAPHYVAGRHPLDFQPLCEEIVFPMCHRGHRKHPVLRFDRDGAPIECGVGFHRAACAEQLYEPVQPAFLHHFPFREKSFTRRRLDKLWVKEGEDGARALQSPYTAHMLTRFRSIEAVYAQDWARVENFVARDPANALVQAQHDGVQLRPWSEIVAREHQPIFRWYSLPMAGAWKYQASETFRYGDDTTYKKGIAFLDGHGLIEDWGCGFAHARSFVGKSEYIGIDGSSPRADKIVDLREYRSQADCIFMRHVLEHNTDWSQILANAVASFRRRMTLVIFTPFSETTTVIATSTTITSFPVPDIAFKKEDLTSHFESLRYSVETLTTDTQYGLEHVFYIEKLNEFDGPGEAVLKLPDDHGQSQTRASEAKGSENPVLFSEGRANDGGTIAVPRLTVVVTTYNEEQFITPAIESILAQETDFPFEVVIIDDCSTDRTREIVIEYQQAHPEKIRLVLLERNRCDNVDFMREVEQAAGEYVAILDGDDYWTSPHKLEKQVEYLDRHPECAICAHNALVVYEDGRLDPHNTNLPDQKETSTIEDLFEGRLVHTASIVVRKAAIGQFPAAYAEEQCADWALILLAASRGTLGYIGETMAVYRIHRGGLWTGLSARQQQRRIVEFYENARAYVPRKYWGVLSGHLARTCCDLAAECEIAGDQQGADQWFSKAVTAELDLRKTQWKLRIAGECAAELILPHDRRDAVHVAIQCVGGPNYDLQLNLRRFRVRKDSVYRILFQARADQRRWISVGFGEAREPWQGLGSYRRIELSTEWQTFEDQFVCTGDRDDARVHFDLGEGIAAVDVAGVTVTDTSSGESVSLYRTAEELAEGSRPFSRNRDSVDESVRKTQGEAKGAGLVHPRTYPVRTVDAQVRTGSNG